MKLTESEENTRTIPVNFQEIDRVYFEKEINRYINAAYLLELPNAIVTHEGIVINNKLSIVNESLIIQIKNKWKFLLSVLLKRKKIIVKNKFLVIHNQWSTGYFHWIADSLTRLEACYEFAQGAILVLPENYKGFQTESLKAFDWPKIIYLKPDEYIKADSILLPELTALPGNYNEILIFRLRARYQLFYAKLRNLIKDKRLYISRDKATKRRVVNEKELLHILKKYDFQVVHIEDYSFEDQVRMMMQTHCLISIHGAGLTNMLFMNTGGKVLEIRKEGDDSNLCYFSLASALKLNYFYLFGKANDKQASVQQANLYVNSEVFEAVIQQMIRV